MTIISQLREEMIVPELAAKSKKEALTELAATVHGAHPEIDLDTLYEVLRTREKLGSTGIGDGIAIPHGKIKGLKEIIICFGRSAKGVHFDSHDNKPAHLFFLLLAPEESAATYLGCLAELSRFLKNPGIRSKLMHAKGRKEIAEIFAERI